MKVVLLHGFTGGPTSWDAVVAGLARGGADSLCLSLLGCVKMVAVVNIIYFPERAF